MSLFSKMQQNRDKRAIPGTQAAGDASGVDPHDRDELRRHLFQRALGHFELVGAADADNEQDLRLLLRGLIDEVIQENRRIVPTPALKTALENELCAELTGLGPLQPLMTDPSVSDILINGPGDVWVDRAGTLQKTAVRFEDAAHLTRILDRMVSAHGRHLEEATPYVDVRLPDGSRLHAIIAPLSALGSVVSIRRHRAQPFSLEQFVASGALSAEAASFLGQAVLERRNILVSGGASAGKTTLLNVLASLIPAGERVVTIEETLEMRVQHPHVIPLESRPANTEGRGEVDLRTLVRNALRMRADRIIVGEVRGAEVFDMLQAMNIGHPGSMTTAHANGVEDALRRLETLVLLSGLALPADHLRGLLAASFQVIVQMERRADGVRQISRIATLGGGDGPWAVTDRFRRAHPTAPLLPAGGPP
jgi:pilus assembly protein CpaF